MTKEFTLQLTYLLCWNS